MFEGINGKRLAGVLLAGVIAFSGATYAFAADQTGSSKTSGQNTPAKMDFSKMTEVIDAALDKLVTAGTITQVQADAVIKVFSNENRGGVPHGERKDMLSDLVTAGTITQTQAEKVSAAMKTAREDALKALVKAGTINSTQLEAIASSMKPGDDKGTPPKGERKAPLAELVSAGTMTQAQADTVNAAIKAAMNALKDK